ncbi:X-ray radiation resistance-associated protein 1 isoform X2 [Solea solea]|uniref:X-ray radiation resistance-associated protein 1 isoform X2 n=1 Tax=Solea solea TaxID=90069 RepID=UPI00272D28DF|nr:X-ray radiation resistance-associated protein 1 isoform X2 [Solea solea]
MAAASCRFDDGQRCPTKCFPARTLLCRRKDGDGHWLVSHRKTEEQRYRRVKEHPKEPEKNRTANAPHGNTLDGALLLRLHCVDKPSELCSVNISEQELNSVKPEDLMVFGNVAFIDASINLMTLGSFSSFVSLRELNLSVNRICNMTFDASDFPHLEVLDLSYNSLSADDIVSISWLPRLKVLHLTGNRLLCLPPNLASSNSDHTQLSVKEDISPFRALEVLMLDDNKLSSGVFNSLRNLRRLNYLNLQGNRISEIPYLQPTKSTEQQAEMETPERRVRGWSAWILLQENLKNHSTGSCLPLPKLQSLNLSDNKIAEEEALMAAALFPMLREMDVHSNPLTTRRSGEPPLLTYCLHERLGITIKRKKTKDVGKPPLTVSTDPKWKVEDRIPKVSKKPLLKEECEGKRCRDDTFQENTQHFFVTQADALSESAEIEEDAAPEKFNCHQMLTDTKLNPDVVEPVGIQTAVRMLEHTLKNLNVYRDSKPTFDNIQMPYREKEKRIKALPPLRPTKQPAERVEELLNHIKESTARREVTLSSAMDGSGADAREHKEVLSLLRDMKTKYEVVYRKTVEQADTQNTKLNGAEPPPVSVSRSV